MRNKCIVVSRTRLISSQKAGAADHTEDKHDHQEPTQKGGCEFADGGKQILFGFFRHDGYLFGMDRNTRRATSHGRPGWSGRSRLSVFSPPDPIRSSWGVQPGKGDAPARRVGSGATTPCRAARAMRAVSLLFFRRLPGQPGGPLAFRGGRHWGRSVGAHATDRDGLPERHRSKRDEKGGYGGCLWRGCFMALGVVCVQNCVRKSDARDIETTHVAYSVPLCGTQ